MNKVVLRVVVDRCASETDVEFDWKLERAAEEWGKDLKLVSGVELDLKVLRKRELEAVATEPTEAAILVAASLVQLSELEIPIENWNPIYAIERGGGIPIELVALARVGGWSAVPGSRLVLCDASDGVGELAYRWFAREVVGGLSRKSWNAQAGRFGRSDSSSRAIHTVFFAGASACVVRRVDFDDAVRRNPQVAEDLSIVGSMPPIIGDVLVLKEGVAAAQVEMIGQAIGVMERSVAGRKVMRLLGWTGLKPMGDVLRKAYENTLEEAEVKNFAIGRLDGERLVARPGRSGEVQEE